MKTLNLIRSAAITLLLFATTSASADEPAKLSPADREAVLAKLKTNKVSLQGLTIVSKKGSPAINLGTGLDGGEANNANDENLRLIAQLPEVEQVMIYKGKITADGLAALAALPKLRYLQMYATEVPAAAFSVLPKLTQLKSLSLSNYIVTDEVISYAGVTGADHLDTGSASDRLHAIRGATQVPAGTRAELRSAQAFRDAWSRISAEDEVTEAVQRGPENAGPLNSHMLLLRTLGLLRELSPDYLQRFMAHADTLLWLEQAALRLKPAAASKGKAARARK